MMIERRRTAKHFIPMVVALALCGAVWGHLGEFPGYTIFAFSSSNGNHQIMLFVNVTQESLPPPAARKIWQTMNAAYCG